MICYIWYRKLNQELYPYILTMDFESLLSFPQNIISVFTLHHVDTNTLQKKKSGSFFLAKVSIFAEQGLVI